MARESTIRWPVLIVACVATASLRGRTVPSAHRYRHHVRGSDRQYCLRQRPPGSRPPSFARPTGGESVVSSGHTDTDALVAAGDVVVAELVRSGLFSGVGTAAAARGITALYADVPSELPLLFSHSDLERDVVPRLETAAIGARLDALAADVSDLAGIGAAERVAEDPLGLGEVALSRLADLVPSQQGRIERGHILDTDGKNLLVAATPRAATSDTRTSYAIDDAIQALARRFGSAKPGEVGAGVVLTSVGGYRAAIDNESLVMRDANLAMLASTIGIALLLLACFPRPWLGLFALLPALAGGCLALFVYSLIESDISALALGFGGALVSITVDQGAVYLLFVDRQKKTAGHRAAHEVFSIGSLSTVINIGSFLSLRLTGFHVLGQIGLFAALGIAFSYLFVHLVFPHIFPTVPAASRSAWVPVDNWLRRLTVGRGFRALAVGVALFAVALVFARPTFVVDLEAMNTIRAETARDEARVRAVWGDIFHRVYVLIDANNDADFRRQSDVWLSLVERQKAAGVLARAFSPSALSPGPAMASEHAAAWFRFWTGERVARVSAALREGAARVGFAPDAFAPFLSRLAPHAVATPPLSEGIRALYGAGPGRDGHGVVWLGSVVPGPKYAPSDFAKQVHEAGLVRSDGGNFSQTLADFLAQSFRSMFVVVVCFVAGAVLLFFLDIRVAAIALAPMTFSFVLTIATLHLIGRPIDIVGLILSVLIFGMGVDYSFSFVRVYQRCLDEHHASHGPVRTSIFLSASATLVGMGTMSTAQHAVTRSAGIMATLAIGYCVAGAYLFLPPLLRHMYLARPLPPPDRDRPDRWVMKRFRRLVPIRACSRGSRCAWIRCFLAWATSFPKRHDTRYRLRLRRGSVLDDGSFLGTARGSRSSPTKIGSSPRASCLAIAAWSTRARRRKPCPRSMLPPWSASTSSIILTTTVWRRHWRMLANACRSETG